VGLATFPRSSSASASANLTRSLAEVAAESEPLIDGMVSALKEAMMRCKDRKKF
jgi:hypothetical protein